MALNRELVKYFLVRWTGLVSVLDGVDPDDYPDLDMLEGTVTFTPNLPRGEMIKFQNIAEPYSLRPLNRKVPIAGGVFNDQNRPYIKLEAPGMAFANPIDWNWRVDFDLYYKGAPVPVTGFSFTGDPDSEVDLTNVMPGQDPLTGISITRGPRGNSIDSVTVQNGDTFVFSLDDEFDTSLPPVTIPALTVQNDTLDAAAAAVAAAELANTDAAAALQYKNVALDAASVAVASAELADADATATAADRAAAATSAGNAAASATAANTSATNASTSEGNAATSATTAVNAKNDAVTAKTAAETAKTAAETAKTAAETAKTAAETARTGAETARTGAETAQAAAEQARDDAIAGVVPDNAVSTIKIQDDAVTIAKVSPSIETSLGKADSAYQKPGSGIPMADLAAAVQASLNKADSALQSVALPCDFVWAPQVNSTRKLGTGDLGNMYVGRPFIVDEVTYQFETADASGSTTVRILKNGTAVVGSSKTVTAADQADTTGTDAARTAVLTDASRQFAKGDRFALDVSALGTTPGKGVRVYVRGTWV